MFRKICDKFMWRFDFIKYARKHGVEIGENCKLQHPSIGTEPYLISIGNHVLMAGG